MQEENLNYAKTERLHTVWPDRFPKNNAKGVADPYESGQPFIHSPHLLGLKVYFGRMGNLVAQEDGFTYRGRGLLQITGREDYDYYGKKMGIDLANSPDLAFDARYAIELAAEWTRKGCNAAADADNAELVTRKINGGKEGLQERKELLVKTKEVWLPAARHSQRR